MTVLVGRSSLNNIVRVGAAVYSSPPREGWRSATVLPPPPPETFELEVKLREKRKRNEMGRIRGKEEIETKYGRRTTV